MALIGYWKLNEGTGLSTLDSSISNNTGFLSSSTLWNIGKDGTSGIFLPTTGDKVDINGSAGLTTGLSNFSVSAWVRHDSVAGLNIVPVVSEVNVGGWEAGQGWVLTFLGPTYTNPPAQNTYEFILEANNGTSWAGQYISGISGASGVTGTGWFHVCGTVSGLSSTDGVSAPTVLIYLNGYNSGVTNDISTPTFVSKASMVNTGTVLIGSSRDIGSTHTFIDDVRIYDTCLTSGEVFSIYQEYLGLSSNFIMPRFICINNNQFVNQNGLMVSF